MRWLTVKRKLQAARCIRSRNTISAFDGWYTTVITWTIGWSWHPGFRFQSQFRVFGTKFSIIYHPKINLSHRSRIYQHHNVTTSQCHNVNIITIIAMIILVTCPAPESENGRTARYIYGKSWSAADETRRWLWSEVTYGHVWSPLADCDLNLNHRWPIARWPMADYNSLLPMAILLPLANSLLPLRMTSQRLPLRVLFAIARCKLPMAVLITFCELLRVTDYHFEWTIY